MYFLCRLNPIYLEPKFGKEIDLKEARGRTTCNDFAGWVLYARNDSRLFVVFGVVLSFLMRYATNLIGGEFDACKSDGIYYDNSLN